MLRALTATGLAGATALRVQSAYSAPQTGPALRSTGYTDVTTFRAVADSTNGTDGTDSTAAIQAAVNSLQGNNRGRIYFPPNRANTALGYRLTGPLVLDAPIGSIELVGDGAASFLVGVVPDYLVKRNATTGTPGPFLIEGLSLANYHPQGNGVRLFNAENVDLHLLSIRVARIALDLRDSVFTSTVHNVMIQSLDARAPGGIGVIISGHAQISGCDITGIETAVVAFGTGADIHGCRFEVCKTALLCGVEPGSGPDVWIDHQLIGADIHGNTFEANDTAIWLRHVAALKCGPFEIQGSPNSPSGSSKYGLRVGTATACAFGPGIANGEYDVAAIAIEEPYQTQTTFKSVLAGNTGRGVVWQKSSAPAGVSFEMCNV